MNLFDIVAPMTMDEAKATKQRLDAKCWKGKHKEGTKVKGGVRVNNCVPNESVKEDNFHGSQDDWHAGDNAWSSENHEMFEGHSFSNGDQVELKPEYADRAGEVYTVSQCDVERGRCWIGDADGRGWYARFDQLVPSVEQDVDEALSKNDLLKQIGDKLNDPEFRKKPADPNIRWEKGDLYKGPGPDDYGYTGYQGHGMPTEKEYQARIRANKKKGVAEMDKSQKGAAGWNIDDYPLGAKGTTAKPTTVKNVVKSATKDLDAAFNQADKKQPKPVKESYWTRLQNERNTKLNSLVNELKESITK
jgi:hypothetical protein